MILLLIAKTKKSQTDAHVDIHVNSGARGLNFDVSLYLHPYLIYASNKGSGEPAHAQTRLRLSCSTVCEKEQKLMCLLI